MLILCEMLKIALNYAKQKWLKAKHKGWNALSKSDVEIISIGFC